MTVQLKDRIFGSESPEFQFTADGSKGSLHLAGWLSKYGPFAAYGVQYVSARICQKKALMRHAFDRQSIKAIMVSIKAPKAFLGGERHVMKLAKALPVVIQIQSEIKKRSCYVV